MCWLASIRAIPAALTAALRHLLPPALLSGSLSEVINFCEGFELWRGGLRGLQGVLCDTRAGAGPGVLTRRLLPCLLNASRCTSDTRGGAGRGEVMERTDLVVDLGGKPPPLQREAKQGK